MYSPFAHLSFWHSAAASPEEAPACYPFAPPASDASDAAARRLAAQLAANPPESRRELLSVLHSRSGLLPWASIHHTWLADILADATPIFRAWALAILPTQLQGPLLAGRPDAARAALIDPHPPEWWPAWFTTHVKRRLGYPDLPPWPVASELPGRLWEEDEQKISRLLAVRGTRGFISAVRTLPREEAQEWIWSLPASCHAVAGETVNERRWSDDPFWPEVFAALAADFPETEARLFRMALADVMRLCVQQGQQDELRRLAFRLPRRWGEWVLLELAAAPDWLQRPPQPSFDAWRDGLGADLDQAPPAPPQAAP